MRYGLAPRPLTVRPLITKIDGKRDGECHHKNCREVIDWKKHDKPPKGWAVLTFQRWGTVTYAEVNLLLCPKHTIRFCERQTSLSFPGTDPPGTPPDRQSP